MQDGRDDLSLFNNGHWKAQPRWVKLLTILVGLPAWLVLMAAVFNDNINATVETVALGAFVATCLLQAPFVFRAYWRTEL
jgi:Ca2+/H+ antiporter